MHICSPDARHTLASHTRHSTPLSVRRPLRLIFAASLLSMLLTGCLTSSKSVQLRAIKLVGDTYGFTEGPIWDAARQRFLFSDIPNNKIYALTADSEVSVVDSESGYANGVAVDKNGNVWAARHDRKVSYTSPTGKKVIVAESYNGHKLNSPNDIVIAQDGSVWFTDPPFGIQGYGPSKAEEEQPVRGIYQFENGSVVLRNGALKLPNGIAFSPDASALFVADTADGYVYRFDVNQGALKNRRKFAIVDPGASKAKLEPTVDGLDVDSKGNLFVAGPGGLGVFSKDGTQIGYYPIDASHISNVAVGGPNGDQLLVTASNKVFLFEIY